MQNTLAVNGSRLGHASTVCAGDGRVQSQGFNILFNIDSCAVTPVEGDLFGAAIEAKQKLQPGVSRRDYVLGAYSEQVGQVASEYYALADGSPAIDAVTNGQCSSVDQLGIDRIMGRQAFGSHCDIGAVEFNGKTQLATVDPGATSSNDGSTGDNGDSGSSDSGNGDILLPDSGSSSEGDTVDGDALEDEFTIGGGASWPGCSLTLGSAGMTGPTGLLSFGLALSALGLFRSRRRKA